jgi:hypothetical protein
LNIVQLIGEIKVQDAASHIVYALENCDLGEDFTSLVAACWQSGLDFSQYLTAFIKIFVSGDYQTAVESFSVIEESISTAGSKMREECINLLDKIKDQVPEEKYLLFRELVKAVSAPLPED